MQVTSRHLLQPWVTGSWPAGCRAATGGLWSVHTAAEPVPAASFYDTVIEKYASQPVEVLSLYQMLAYGRNAHQHPEKILKSARYVQRELPKRLARRLMDLQLLPYIVVTNPHIKRVYDNYYTSFNVLRQLPPVHTLDDNATFTWLLRKQLDQHAPMLDALATGLREVKGKQLVGDYLHLDAFFDSMLRSRISRRVIAEQHLQLADKRPGYIGIIETDLDVADAVDLAAQKTRQVCMETYGVAPEFAVSGDVGARVPYISAHLDYMLYELLKNAARAVVEHHTSHHLQGGAVGVPGTRYSWHSGLGSKGRSASARWLSGRALSGHLPPVQVRICAGHHAPDLTIKISDQGGGVPPHIAERIWSYGFTTLGGIPAGYNTPGSHMQHGMLHHMHLPPQPQSAGQQLPQAWPGPSPTDAQPHAVLHGVLPSGYAAANAHYSHWHVYSPSTVASGPYAPQVPTSSSTPHSQRHHPGGCEAPAVSMSAPVSSAGHDRATMAVEQQGVRPAPGGGLMGLMGDGDASGAGQYRMAGLGFGLPLSRLYSRYFGGDLTLVVVPSYGTDAYLTIRRLEEGDWSEQLDP